MMRAILCGLALVVLAVASIVLHWCVGVPLAGEYDYDFLKSPDCLVWYDQQRFSPTKKGIGVCELDSDRMQILRLDQIPMANGTLANGDYLRLDLGSGSDRLQIYDRKSLTKIREVQLPSEFSDHLVNQRYLISERNGVLFVCDVMADDPSRLMQLPLVGWQPNARTELFPVGGSNLVVEVSAQVMTPAQAAAGDPPLPTFTNNVYRIEPGGPVHLATWTSCGSWARIMRQGNRLVSVSADGLKLEGRDLKTFQLVNNQELPAAIARHLAFADFMQDVCVVREPKTGDITHYRLDTLKELRNTKGMWLEESREPLQQQTTSYRIFYGTQSLTGGLSIYDLDSDKIIFEKQYDHYFAATILDSGRLAVAHSHYSLTAEIYDLESGQLIKLIRPFAWLLPWYLVWSVAAVCAAFGWIYYSARAGITLLTSILLLAATLVPIEIYPLTQYGTTVNIGRLATAYSFAALLSSTAGLAWLGFCRLQNYSMRSTYQLAVLSIIALVLVTLEQHDSFREQWMLPAIAIIASFNVYASFMGLMILWFLGYRVRWIGGENEMRLKPSILHFFALNAACAGLFVACLPLRIASWSMPNDPSQFAGALPTVIPFAFVFLLLKMSDRWFQRWTVVAACGAGLLVLDLLAAAIRPHLFTMPIAMAYGRVCLASFVITFLWLWAFRLRGCRIGLAHTK